MKKNGFTMIELLASIIILGILTTVAIIVVNGYQSKLKEKYYQTQEALVIVSAKEYYGNNHSLLPKNNATSSRVALNELVDKDYIEEVHGYDKKLCNLEESYVYVTKKESGKYEYSIFLKCEENGEIVLSDPVLTLNGELDESGKAIFNISFSNYNFGIATFVYSYSDDNGVTYSENIEIDANPKTIIFNEAGIYKVRVTAMDWGGKTITRESDSIEVKESIPMKPIIELDIDSLTNQNVTATIIYDDISAYKKYKINDGPWENYENPLLIEENCIIYAKGASEKNIFGDEEHIEIDYIDKEEPNIVLSKSTVTIIKGNTYELRGLISEANDNVTASANLLITISPSTTTSLDVGTYTITYSTVDEAGNTGIALLSLIVNPSVVTCYRSYSDNRECSDYGTERCCVEKRYYDQTIEVCTPCACVEDSNNTNPYLFTPCIPVSNCPPKSERCYDKTIEQEECIKYGSCQICVKYDTVRRYGSWQTVKPSGNYETKTCAGSCSNC